MNMFNAVFCTSLGFAKRRSRFGRVGLGGFFAAVWLVLAGQMVLAQAPIYTYSNTGTPSFQRVDFSLSPSTSPPTTVNRANYPGSGVPYLCGVGTFMYGSSGNQVYKYDPTANTWTLLTASATTFGTILYTDGTRLFQQNASTGGSQYVYDFTANTWTTIPAASNTVAFSGVGVVYIAGNTAILKYNASTATQALLTSSVTNGLTYAYCADANHIYAANATELKIYNLTTSTWTTETAPPTKPPTSDAMAVNANTLYYRDGAKIYRYTLGSNGAWTSPVTLANSPTNSGIGVLGSFLSTSTSEPVACAAPTFTATATPATCAGATANANGTIALTTFDGNAKKVDVSIGATYTGAGFASATAVSGIAPFTVRNNLPNPTVNQPYTIRVFCDATTYTDKTVMLAPKLCQSANLSLSISPANQTGNAGEFVTYVLTLTNAGPDVATNVGVSVPMPDATTATLLSAQATVGDYSSVTQKWTVPSLPVGNTTLTFTVKVN